jgi:hypothetical protein
MVRTKLVHFPTLKSLDSFNFDAQPSLYRRAINELESLASVERAENVVLLGPPGVGKTHLAIGLGMRALQRGHRVYFVSAQDLLGQIRVAQLDGIPGAQAAPSRQRTAAHHRRTGLCRIREARRDLALPAHLSTLRAARDDHYQQQAVCGLEPHFCRHHARRRVTRPVLAPHPAVASRKNSSCRTHPSRTAWRNRSWVRSSSSASGSTASQPTRRRPSSPPGSATITKPGPIPAWAISRRPRGASARRKTA